jgi:galactokinase
MSDLAHLLNLGMSPTAAARQAEAFEACNAALGSLGSARTRWSIWVPGRVELLGKHTDYAGGRSLLCAVERGFVVRAALRADRRVRAIDVASGERCETTLDPTLPPPDGQGWPRYIQAVASRLARNFSCASRGVDLAFCSDLPIAAGMSSSSALMIAVFVSLAKSNDLRSAEEFRREISSREELASYLGCIESGESFRSLAGDAGVGTFGGSQDHTAIMCSEPGRVVQYSFAPVRREAVYRLPPTHTLVIAASGVAAEKTAGARDAYNRLSAMVRHLVGAWNAATGRADSSLAAALGSSADALPRLRDIAAAAVGADQRGTLGFDGPTLVLRLDQFALEAGELIPAAGAALARGAVDDLGAIAERSQAAAEAWLGNQIPQTVALVRSVRALGATAASAFGAGFGGSVWALVPIAAATDVVHRWHAEYARAFPADAARSAFFVSPAGPGAMQWS